MYDIKRQVDEDHINSWFYQTKNECGQIIRCEFYESTDYPVNHFNFTFYIRTKRVQEFPDGKITGKDGIKSLVWAYRCLLDCIKFLKRYPYSILHVSGDTKRKMNIYKHYCLPLGFRISQDKNKELVLKIENYKIQ